MKIETYDLPTGSVADAAPSHDAPAPDQSSQPAITRLPTRAAQGASKPVRHALLGEAPSPAPLIGQGEPWAGRGMVDVELLVAWALGVQRVDANPVRGMFELEAKAAGYEWDGHSPDGCWAIERRHMIGATVDVSGGPAKETAHPAALAVGHAVGHCGAASIVRHWGRLGMRPDGWREPARWIVPRHWRDPEETGEWEHCEGNGKSTYTPIMLARSPASIELARANYTLWREAMLRLWAMLSARALGFVVLPPAAPEEPWKDEQHGRA